jgi:hypothetical protein
MQRKLVPLFVALAIGIFTIALMLAMPTATTLPGVDADSDLISSIIAGETFDNSVCTNVANCIGNRPGSLWCTGSPTCDTAVAGTACTDPCAACSGPANQSCNNGVGKCEYLTPVSCCTVTCQCHTVNPVGCTCTGGWGATPVGPRTLCKDV